MSEYPYISSDNKTVISKMTHQDAICLSLEKILSLDDEAMKYFLLGHPFGKILRSYDQFTSDGKPLYRNARGKSHYRYSIEAFSSGYSANQLYGEHRIPLKIVKERLIASDRSLETITRIMKSNEVVLITDHEQKLLDSRPPIGLGLRSKLPSCGTDRLKFAGIMIAEETLNNRL